MESIEFDLSVLLIERAIRIKHEDLRNNEESWLPHTIRILLQQVAMELVTIWGPYC